MVTYYLHGTRRHWCHGKNHIQNLSYFQLFSIYHWQQKWSLKKVMTSRAGNFKQLIFDNLKLLTLEFPPSHTHYQVKT